MQILSVKIFICKAGSLFVFNHIICRLCTSSLLAAPATVKEFENKLFFSNDVNQALDFHNCKICFSGWITSHDIWFLYLFRPTKSFEIDSRLLYSRLIPKETECIRTGKGWNLQRLQNEHWTIVDFLGGTLISVCFDNVSS